MYEIKKINYSRTQNHEELEKYFPTYRDNNKSLCHQYNTRK